MRSVFMILLLANLLFFAFQFDVVRALVSDHAEVAPRAQLNAERLRIVRDASPRTPP